MSVDKTPNLKDLRKKWIAEEHERAKTLIEHTDKGTIFSTLKCVEHDEILEIQSYDELGDGNIRAFCNKCQNHNGSYAFTIKQIVDLIISNQ